MRFNKGSDGPKTKVGRASLRKTFQTIIWPRRRLLLFGLFLIVFNRLARLVLPAASKYIVDEVITAGQRDLLFPILGGLALAVAIQSVTSYLLTRLLSVEAQNLIAELRTRVQRHVLRLPVRSFEATTSGALVSRIMNDAEGVRNLVGTGIVHLIGGALTAAVSLVLLLRIDAVLTAWAFGPLIIFGFIALKAFRVIRPIFRERSRINAEVSGRLTETLGGIRVIKGFHAEAREEKVFHEGAHRIYENVKKSLTATSLVTSSATFLMGVGMAVVMAIGTNRILDGVLTIGEFFAFTMYLGLLIVPIVQMAGIGTQLTEAFAGLDRIEEILHEPMEGETGAARHPLATLEGDLRFEDVTFAYDEGKPVVHEISFHAPVGSVTALVGSSGSGKSTIAGLMASFLIPTSGRVLIDGNDLASVELGDYRRHLGVVLQDDFLFEGTIRENVLFARPDASEDRLHAALRDAHVLEFTDRFELGLETVIGERGVKLSGGQRQRVAIARALLADPKVLLLDEATSNLDAESERLIQGSFERLLSGRTTLVIAHRLSTIRRANQILVIEDGRIVERGRHDELLALGGRYHQLHEFQARI